MSNLIHEEQILVQDIFLVKTSVNSPNVKNDQEILFLKDFSRDISSQGQGFSLIKNESMFDSMLMERAGFPNTNTLEYFCGCYNRALDQKDKPWNTNNQHSQDFIAYSMKIISSFAYLALTSPELFDQQYIDPSWLQYHKTEDQMASKIISFFDKVGYSYEFFNELDKQIQQEDNKDEFNESLLTILIDNQRKVNILNQKHTLYLHCLVNLLQIEHYKQKFINLKKYPFIPNQKGQNVKDDKGLDEVKGIDLELRSALGPFLRISTIDFLIQNEEDKRAIVEMRNKVFLEFNNIRSQQQYNLSLKYYSEMNQNYTKVLVELFKILLKKTNNYNYAQDTLRFVSACIIGNKDKAKLYRRLESQNKQPTTSSDAFLMNLFDVLLDISKIIFNKNDNKWEKVKPEYFSQSPRLTHLKEEPFFSKEKIIENNNSMIEEISEFGTITEYFFLTQQLAHFSLVPILADFKDNAEQLQRTQKELKRMSPNHQFYKLAEQKVNEMKAHYFQYDAFLQMDSRLYLIRDMYDLLFFLLPKWLKLDITKLFNNNIIDYKPSSLLNTLPENMVTDVFDFHYFYTNFRKDYVKNCLNQEYINSFLDMTILCLSNCQISSNPYLKAKLVEILFFFYHSDKAKVHSILSNNQQAKRNITASLMKFYIDIEFTGDSHQFYSKFNYRHYVNYIYTKLWVDETYQNEMKKLINEPLFERFINMLINDATYCTDEGISNMQKIQEIKSKQDISTLSPQDYQMYERTLATSSHFNKQSRETINLIANISQWAPQPFLSDTFLDIISSMLNSFLKKMMDPTLNQYNDKETDFNSTSIVRDLVTIFSSLGHDKSFRQKVTADIRSFDQKLFETALKRARKEQQTNFQILDKFQIFINNLVETDSEQQYENFPEEFQCSISLDILKDPVMLPSSRCVVERSIIKKALLDNEIDPFNRSPLKVNQLIEMPELKKKIEEWKSTQKQNSKNDEINDEQLEDALQGDIPDEFTCALSFCLLNDPVRLPTSHQNVERYMIKKALLDNEIDPFNRQPLKREQLIELPELKKKLDEWKLQKKKELKEKGTISSNNNKMDVEKDKDDDNQYKQNLFSHLE